MSTQTLSSPLAQPSFAELYTPKLVTVFREGYSFANFQADLMAGLTVAIVALPLSMAIAIGSHATPAQGLYTSIVGGFVVSALSGSRFQIGGPAGAFIVLVAATVQQHGMDGLILATILSGLMLMAIGYLRLGTYIKFIPYPVTVGFTAGIAVTIFSSEIKPLLGLVLQRRRAGTSAGKAPLPVVEAAHALARRARPLAREHRAVGGLAHLAAALAGHVDRRGVGCARGFALKLPVDTIGSQFGGIPRELPLPALPQFSLEKAQAVLPNAISFALLGAIESLLSAVVADSMTGRRHRSNCELVGQGVANIASGLFGGICVTGTVARTATNVRAGAHSPVSGMAHSLFLILFILIAAPLASYIPLAGLAAVLAVVCWNMFERDAFATLLRASRGDAVGAFGDIRHHPVSGTDRGDRGRLRVGIGAVHPPDVADDSARNARPAGGGGRCSRRRRARGRSRRSPTGSDRRRLSDFGRFLLRRRRRLSARCSSASATRIAT